MRNLPLPLTAVLLAAAAVQAAELKPETLEAWQRYVAAGEARMHSELESEKGFLVQDFLAEPAARRCRAAVAAGEVCIEEMPAARAGGKPIDVPSGLIHHWMGSIFVPGADLASLLAWVQDYDAHERYYDEVEDSRLIGRDGERFEMFLRLKRTKVLTVHYNTTHEVIYRGHGADRASSASRTTRVAEIEDPGEPDEREKPPGDDRGFLWRLNSYWRFEERDGGVAVSCESLSLSRGLPFGVGWLIKGYVKSVPRESMQTTLAGLRDGFALSRARRVP